MNLKQTFDRVDDLGYQVIDQGINASLLEELMNIKNTVESYNSSDIYKIYILRDIAEIIDIAFFDIALDIELRNIYNGGKHYE